MADRDFDYDLLSELTETSGVPGYEDRVRSVVRREMEAFSDSVRTDAMGNVVGTVNPNGEYAIIVAAHMDEIGFMVRHITDDGFLELDALGGWDARVMRAQRVTVHGRENDVPGVIGSPPPHTQDDDERSEPPDVEDLYVDVGMTAESVEEAVAVGDVVTMDQETRLVGDHVTGKALDDRICVFVMLEAARKANPNVTVHYVATVQEEVGLRGAAASSVDIDADMAIALDVTVANDLPGFEAGEHVTGLGDGVAIKIKDSSVITTPKIHRRLREVAEERDITYQLEVLPSGGTDTAAYQTEAGPRPVGAISIPTRYLHTVTESSHVDDVSRAIELLVGFLESETGDHDYTM